MTLLSLTQLLLLPTMVLAAYNYDRCDLTEGPLGTSGWSGACVDQVDGTPIDLCGGVAFSSTAPTLSVSGYSTSRTVSIVNVGLTIQLNIPTTTTAPTITAENLAFIVGQASVDSTATWQLAQMHLHWGRSGMLDEGSEHYFYGTGYAAEAHFVHFNTAAGSDLIAAATSGRSDALLVVGVMLKAGVSDSSATIAAMAKEAATNSGTATSVSSIVLSDLFDGSGDYWSYNGGLTTPTCDSIVTWVVMTQPATISMTSLGYLWSAPIVSNAVATTTTISTYGNYRPLVGTFNRTVYNSAGATAPCSSITQPVFSCSSTTTTTTTTSAAWSMHPSVIPQLAALLLTLWALR